MIRISDIQSLHIELTTKCNARCPMCMRNYRGYTYNGGYPIIELTLPQIQKIFPVDFLKQIKTINFNGNLGDFGLAKNAALIVKHLLDCSDAQIQIETNGSMRTPAWWGQLAHPRVKILWALDGTNNDTHQLYRIGANYDKALKNALGFISMGGNAIWKFIPFKHNVHQCSDAERLSKQLGFSDFILYDQGRNQGPVYTHDGQFSHWLGNSEPEAPPVTELLKDHETWFDPSTVIAKTDISDNYRIDCMHLQGKEIYIAANGDVYPCCYLGFYPDSMNFPGNSQIKKMVFENNALEHSLEHCIKWFADLYSSWNKKTVSDGKPFICLQTCGKCT